MWVHHFFFSDLIAEVQHDFFFKPNAILFPFCHASMNSPPYLKWDPFFSLYLKYLWDDFKVIFIFIAHTNILIFTAPFIWNQIISTYFPWLMNNFSRSGEKRNATLYSEQLIMFWSVDPGCVIVTLSSQFGKIWKNVNQGHYHTGPQPTRCWGTDRLKTLPALPTISIISV